MAKFSPSSGAALDITERRQLEAQLLQAQKMEAIGQLAGGIAHDFSNLLMIIKSCAESAQEAVKAPPAGSCGPRTGETPELRLPAGETPVQRATICHALDEILKAADRGVALIRQLLAFGRKQVFSPRLLDINSVLQNLTQVLPRALGENIQVEVCASADLWQVKADPVQVEQLILNLAVNARDAMPGGGRLILETSNTVLDGDSVKSHAGVAPGEYVVLAVSDTGTGIPPETLPRIFEPFFTTKERGKGTGLGLSTVHGIVQQSGGWVWVDSEIGGGTVFKIYLPRAAPMTDRRAPSATGQVPVRAA